MQDLWLGRVVCFLWIFGTGIIFFCTGVIFNGRVFMIRSLGGLNWHFFFFFLSEKFVYFIGLVYFFFNHSMWVNCYRFPGCGSEFPNSRS